MKKLLLLFLLLGTLTFGKTITGTVTYIYDGDTLHVQTDTQKYKIRFYGIDTPERSQDFGKEARLFVKNRVWKSEVTVEIVDTDSYGRSVGKVYYDDGKYLNKELVGAGLARWYERYAKDDYDLKSAEQRAKNSRLGFWKDPNFIAPWDYRRQ